MPKKNSHPDVEFLVLGPSGKDKYFKSLDEAAAFIFREAMQGGMWTNLSVLVHSEAGARWWQGDDGVERYRSDPDASVFDQLHVKVQSGGMVA
jgi:hypothetical protein